MLTRGFVASFLIEFGPVVLFFFAAREFGILAGTATLVIATLTALTWSRVRDGRIPLFSVLSSSFVFVFGLATLVSMNPYWMILEYTLYNGLFGIALLIALLYDRPLLKPLFESLFHITDHAWKILSLRWSFFFILIALGNEYVWRIYGEDEWVTYRLLASLFLCAFGFTQLFLLRTQRLPHANDWGLRK